MPILACGGCIRDIFVTEEEFINRFTGQQLFNWGNNANGRLGDNTVVNKSSPVQTVSGGTNWKQISAGQSSSAAIKTDGTLWLWGNGTYGQLGNNLTAATASRSSPIQTVSAGTNWKQVVAGNLRAAAIKTDGTLWVWGIGTAGALGTNSVVNRSSPTQTISGGTNWKQVTMSTEGTITSAVKTDGSLWIWGINTYGNMGDNTVVSKSSPVQTISAGTNWKSVAAGDSHVVALKTDGTLWTWGRNNAGQLGRNNVANSSSPVQTVSAGTDWKQISAGSGISAAIKNNGSLWLWGTNGFGQIGDNSTISRSSPVQTVSGGTNWRQVSNSFYVTGAVKTDGTLWMWGSGNSNFTSLGENLAIRRSSPIQTISGGTDWRNVSVGAYHTIATNLID